LISIILLNNNIKIIEFLLECKINVNFIDESGKSALMYAVEKGYFDVAILLIKHNANIYMIDNNAKNI
jgi:ankyrin repeat protein